VSTRDTLHDVVRQWSQAHACAPEVPDQLLDAFAAEVIAARDAQVAAEFQQVIDTAPDQRVADNWRDNATAYHAIVRSLQTQDGAES